MLFLYFKLIDLIPLLLFLLLLFILSIKYKIDVKFKKNCFKCKYKCGLKNIYCNHNFNDRVKLTKCKEFEMK